MRLSDERQKNEGQIYEMKILGRMVLRGRIKTEKAVTNNIKEKGDFAN